MSLFKKQETSNDQYKFGVKNALVIILSSERRHGSFDIYRYNIDTAIETRMTKIQILSILPLF